MPSTIWTHLMDTPFRQTYVRTARGRIRCLIAGDGPPLIMLHSGGGFAESYARNIKDHARHFTTYVPDQLGYGLSDSPADADYSLGGMVSHLADFQDAIGEVRVRISGLSVGAWIAALYAGSFPNRVERLVLNSGVPLQPDAKGRAEFQQRIAGKRKYGTEQELRDGTRGTLRSLINADDGALELSELSYRLKWAGGRAAEMRARIDSQLGEMMYETDMSSRQGPAALQAVECPTLIVWPRHNPGQSLELAQQAAKIIRSSSLHVFENARHWPQWEQPADFNRLQLDFLLGRTLVGSRSEQG